LKAGARAYLLKDSAESDLVRAIHAVAEGKSFFSPAVSKVLLEDYVRKLQRAGGEDSFDLLKFYSKTTYANCNAPAVKILSTY